MKAFWNMIMTDAHLAREPPQLAAPLCQANLWTKISPTCAHLAGARPY